jgi:hypothetical protein
MIEDYHIDLSGRLFDSRQIGIACMGAISKTHCGCAISKQLKQKIQKDLFRSKQQNDCAKLYAILIFYLIVSRLNEIKRLIICNDADFTLTKKYLQILLKKQDYKFQIINITEFKRALGRNINSPADNFAGHYRKRGLKKSKWENGRKLNVVQINYESIKTEWEEIKM